MKAQKVTESTIEEEDKEHLHLPLLVPQGAFQEFSPALGLIVFREKSVATNLR